MKLQLLLMMACLLPLLYAAPAASQHNIPPRELENVGITEKLGEYISGDITLFNEHGEEVTLDSYLNNGRPIILAMVYYECPMLCNLILQGMMRGVRDLSWQPGEEYDILAVSISPTETPELARESKQIYVEMLNNPEAADGIHFMTGSEAEVRRLGDEVGFYYQWNEQTQEYMHGSALIFLSENGRISRYLNGIDYPELMLRNALSDAADGRIGTALDRVVLYCFQFDASSGSYVPVAVNIMKLGGAATLLLLGLFLGFFYYRERKTHK
ncbi:SCO family protein [Balneolales bacterium ANBcel1]|nr:SCO family protein [Balneolales bacterium ANBcel1]